MPVILTTWEVEIKWIKVLRPAQANISRDHISKIEQN
jgi:hypothetical protein